MPWISTQLYLSTFLQNYREAIRFLKALNSELLNEKNFSILIEYFGSDLWDKGMLINLFEKETLIMFKKLHNHEKFFDPSFSRYYSYEGRCFIVSDDDKKSEKDKLTVEDFKTSIRYVNKKRVWNPVLQLETRGFDEGFEYKQGLLMAENVIDKIKYFYIYSMIY